MPLGATGRADLREKLVKFLHANIPVQGISSSDPRFEKMTGGWTTEKLKQDWAAGKKTTCCNAFAQWVAFQLEAKGALSSGQLNLSGVERDVEGSWLWANSVQAGQLHPLPGDFFCSSFPGQEWGHVGIVTEIDDDTLAWRWVAGGQGGAAVGADFIRWGPWLPDQSKTFEQARPKVMGWVDIGTYFFPDGPE